MEPILESICFHAPHAHWFLFLLLLLAGLNVPISEDIILITGGAVASTCTNASSALFLWLLLGCALSAWEAYWIGRLLGPKLYDIKWFNRFLNPERIQRLHYYYEKFGIWTFIVGRFIPGGVRNGLFMTAGLGKMSFPKFIMRDGFACLISASIIFYAGYSFGENYHMIVETFHTYQKIAITFLLLTALILAILYYRRSGKIETDCD